MDLFPGKGLLLQSEMTCKSCFKMKMMKLQLVYPGSL